MKFSVSAIVAASLIISSNLSLTMTPVQQKEALNKGQVSVQTIASQTKKQAKTTKTATTNVPKKYSIKLKTSGNLNLRKSASSSSKILAVIKKGTVVYAQKVGNAYVHVYVNGKEGYLYAQYLTKDGKAIPYPKETAKKKTTTKAAVKTTTTKKTTKATTSKTTTKSGGKNRWGITLTEAEKKMLAQITYLEAGDQSDVGEQAVIVVIFNRMKSSYYKGSLQSVLSSPGQFTTWKFRSRAKEGSREYKNIETVLSGKSEANDWKYLYFNMSHGKFKYGDHYFS